MSGTGRTLRVAIVGVRVQEPRRYHVSVQVLPSNGLPAGVAVGTDAGWATRPDQVARTETSELSRTPEFACSSFVLRLPQPLANSAGEQPLLRVDLYAAPAAAGGGVPGAGALDELVGSGSVAARGDAAARLLRGERVMVPVALGEPGGGPGAGGGMMASYDDLGSMGAGALGGLGGMASFGGGFGGMGSGAGSMGGGGALGGMGLGMGGVGLMSRSREVLLELLLLDAALVLPRDAFALRANYAGALGAPGGGAAGGGGGGSLVRRGGGGGSGECSLLLLVSRADNLPLVLGDTGVEVEPDTFVALKALRDGRSSMAAQALTRVAARSCSPVWNQVLTMRVPEGEVQREQVLIAIVNNANSRLMIKASLPLGALVPYKHYNLRLVMPGGPLGSAVHLYVTAVLTDCPRLQQRHLRNHMADARQLLQARLASASAPLCSLAGSPHDAMSGGEVFGVWRVLDGAPPGAAPAPGCSPQSPPTLLDADPYTTLDTGDEAAAAATLHALADEHAARVKACGGSGCSVLEVVPLQCGGGPGGDPEQLLWPPGHMVSLLYGTPPSAASAAPVLQLAVYQLGGPTRGAGVGPAAQNAPAGKVAAMAAAAAGAVAPATIAGVAGAGAGAAAGGIGTPGEGVGDAAEAASTAVAAPAEQGSAAEGGASRPGSGAPVAGAAHESGAQPRPAGPVAEGTEDGEAPEPDPAAAAPLPSPAGSLRSTSLPLAAAPPPARPSSGGGSVGVRSSAHLDRIMAKYGQAPEHVMLSNATAVAAADVGPPVVSSAVVPPPASQRAAISVAAVPPDAVGSVVYVPAGLRAAVQGKATTGLRRELVLVGLAAAPLPPRPAAHLTAGGPGEVQLVDGVEVVPAGVAAAAGRRGAAVVVGMEVRRRDTAAVVSALENEYPDDPRSSVGGAGAGGGGWWGDSLSMVAWQEGAAAGGLGPTAGGGGGGAAASVVEALVDDCILKQVAVARLVRAAEAAAAQLEMASWRGTDVENRSRSLAEDNAKLRQLLHEEKQAWRIPQLLPDATTLSRDELIERCEAAMAGYGRERRRNAELVHRLQQLHGEQVDTVELKKRYQQLQEAHMEQARAQTALEGLDARAAQMRATLRTQEDVIRNLEALLSQAVSKAKHAEREAQQERSAHADAERLQQQLQQLAQQRDEQAWAVQQAEEEAKAAKEALQQLEARNAALEQQQGQQQQEQALGASGKREVTPTPPASAQAPNDAAQAPAPDPDPELQRQLEEAQARNQELEEQLEAAKAGLQAAASEREKELQAELEEAQRKLAEAEGQLAEARERVAALEAQLAELQEKLGEKEAQEQAEGQREREGGRQQQEEKEPAKQEAEPKKAEGSEDLEAAVAQLTEEKTAAILRAELAESAAEAAQGELIESTKKFAREIAELKTRLAEKDAQLMGGFGDLEALRRGELPPPDLSMPLWGNGGGGGGGPNGQGNGSNGSGSRHGVSTPPGMIMPNHQPPVPLRPTGSPGAGAGRGGAGRAGSAGSGGLLPPIRGSSSRDSARPAPPEPRRTSQDRQQPAPLQRAPELPRKGGAGSGGKAGKQAQGKQPAARRAQQQVQQDEEDDEEDDDDDAGNEEEEDDEPAPPAKGVAARGPVQSRQ